MIYLKDSKGGGGLTVSILDPQRDRDRLGSRYCTGGYIWQVEDEKSGLLFSGPTFPDLETKFGGQGAPEAFEIALGSDSAQVGDEVCVLGVGMVKRESSVKPFHVRDNFTVTRFAEWSIEEEAGEVVMQTSQSYREVAFVIQRRVRLRGRELESFTEITNVGERLLPLRWFAHPFFPVTEKLCRFSLETFMPPNPAFELDADDFVKRRAGFDWEKGFFQPLQMSFGFPLQIEQMHPKIGSVKVSCDFPLAHLPIWGNDRTFSFEPYFHTQVDPGAKTNWSIRYLFS